MGYNISAISHWVEMVLDPLMGSGTTGKVCDELRRSFVVYDLKKFI